MKKSTSIIKTILVFTLIILCFYNTKEENVFASEVDVVTYDMRYDAELTVTAKVHKEYDGDIAFIFTKKENGFNYQLVLTKKNDYTGSMIISGNADYTPTVVLKKDDNLFKITGISNDDIYEVTGNKVKINFDVEKGISKNKNNLGNIELVNPNTEMDDIITESTNLISPEEAYKNYIDSISFIDNNKDFESYLSAFGSDIMKNQFLNADSTNTIEDWKNMSDFERYNYDMLFTMPRNLITGINSVSSEEQFMDALSFDMRLLGKIDKGDIVTDALREMWRWIWKNWEQTGEFVNIYDPYTKGSVQKHTNIELKDTDEEEIEEVRKEVQKELENKNLDEIDGEEQEETRIDRVKKDLKRNIISIIVLIITGIVIIRGTIKRRKKNIDKVED